MVKLNEIMNVALLFHLSSRRPFDRNKYVVRWVLCILMLLFIIYYTPSSVR